MTRWKKGLGMLLCMGTLLFSAMPECAAEIVEGQAAIENGNVAKARVAAKQDAMRSYVERIVGTHISSSTEVAMGMVVSDRIMAQSNGYVKVNRLVKEWQQDDIYCVQLDLDASAAMIDTALSDVRGQLEALDDTSSRSGIMVAVAAFNESGRQVDTMQMTQYVQSKLETTGFRVVANDDVRAYMSSHYADMSDPAVGAEIRRIARNHRSEENALLRGTLSTVQTMPVKGGCKAIVNASFEIIGFDSNAVNSFSEYFTAIDRSESEAVEKAQRLATQAAVEELGQKALRTVQSETRGGQQHVKTTIVVRNIGDRSQQVLDALREAGCKVIRSSITSMGELKVFVDAVGFEGIQELKETIVKKMPGIRIDAENEVALGSTKIYLTL